MDFSMIVKLVGGIALFLFGMKLMGDGMKSVAGNKLELILYRLSNTIPKGVLLGTGVTAVIQSSCATSVMVVGFVNSGMMKLRQAYTDAGGVLEMTLFASEYTNDVATAMKDTINTLSGQLDRDNTLRFHKKTNGKTRRRYLNGLCGPDVRYERNERRYVVTR